MSTSVSSVLLATRARLRAGCTRTCKQRLHQALATLHHASESEIVQPQPGFLCVLGTISVPVRLMLCVWGVRAVPGHKRNHSLLCSRARALTIRNGPTVPWTFTRRRGYMHSKRWLRHRARTRAVPLPYPRLQSKSRTLHASGKHLCPKQMPSALGSDHRPQTTTWCFPRVMCWRQNLRAAQRLYQTQ